MMYPWVQMEPQSFEEHHSTAAIPSRNSVNCETNSSLIRPSGIWTHQFGIKAVA